MDATASSMSLDDNRADSGGITHSMLHRAANMLLGRNPQSMRDFEVLGSRLGKAIRRKPYTGYYIRYVMCGEQPITKPIARAVKKLIEELKVQPARNKTKEVTVQVPYGVLVPDGSLIMASARTCICGITFVPRIWNQINHSRACAKMRAKTKKRTS